MSLLEVDNSHYDRLIALGFDDRNYITQKDFPYGIKPLPVVVVIKWLSGINAWAMI